MIHQYKSNGYNIVMDVCSGAVHVVDDITYDVIAAYEENNEKNIETNLELLQDKLPQYSKEELQESLEEVEELKSNGELFAEDVYKEFVMDFKKRKTVVKALCLHIAHDCNLGCRYCFAEEGEYHGDRSLMSL